MPSVMEILGSEVSGKDGPVTTSSFFKDGHVVGLYFSAHWCPPCRGFTPKLADFYKKHKQDKNFEVVFVSSDRDEESFKEYYNEMPWLSLPYGERDKKANLSRKYKVQGIPMLVLLDGKGNVITTDGRGKVAADPEATEFPWLPKSLSAILEGVEVMRGTEKTTMEAARKDKVLGLYFSAHWCPPCRSFTPELVKTYNMLKEQGKNFEVIFVSSDRSEDAFKEYYETMPWLSTLYSDKKTKEALSQHFDIQGIPTLVILDENLEVITANGRGAVSQDKEGKKFPWIPEPLGILDETSASDVNETPTLLYLTGNGDEAHVTRAKELLQDVAQSYRAKMKEQKKEGKEEIPELTFLYEAAESEDLAESIRGFANLEDRNPLVAIIDIQGQTKFVYPEGDLTKEKMQQLVNDYENGKLEFKPLRT